MNNYRISPSLIQKVMDWANAEENYDKYWGRSESPSLTLEEYQEKQTAELVAYMNGDPTPPSEAADRGTCLNEIIDCMIGNEPNGNVQWTEEPYCYRARTADFSFDFDKPFVDSLALMFKNSVAQYHLRHTYDLGTYSVTLHGFADYIFPTMIWDLKTTSKYEAEKYLNGIQRLLYPVVAVDSGAMTRCDTFTYYAIEMRADNRVNRNGVLTGKPFAETYDVNVEGHRDTLFAMVRGLVVPTINQFNAEGAIPNNTIITQ